MQRESKFLFWVIVVAFFLVPLAFIAISPRLELRSGYIWQVLIEPRLASSPTPGGEK